MSDNPRPSLLGFLAGVWLHEARKRCKFAHDEVQEAARRALAAWKPPPFYLPAEYVADAYVESLYPPEAGDLVFPDGPWEMTQRMRALSDQYAIWAQQEYQQLARGARRLVRWDSRERKPDFRQLQAPLWYRVREHLSDVRLEHLQSMIKSGGDTSTYGSAWEFVVKRFIEATRLVGVDSDALEKFLELQRVGLDESTPLSAEIARLSDAGLAQTLLEGLRQEFPAVVDQLERPEHLAAKPGRKRRTRAECDAANERLKVLYAHNPKAKKWGQRQLMRALKVSAGLLGKLPAYREIHPKRETAPTAVALTEKVLNAHVDEQAELDRLVAEHEADKRLDRHYAKGRGRRSRV
jgi:hypothetical protein